MTADQEDQYDADINALVRTQPQLADLCNMLRGEVLQAEYGDEPRVITTVREALVYLQAQNRLPPGFDIDSWQDQPAPLHPQPPAAQAQGPAQAAQAPAAPVRTASAGQLAYKARLAARREAIARAEAALAQQLVQSRTEIDMVEKNMRASCRAEWERHCAEYEAFKLGAETAFKQWLAKMHAKDSEARQAFRRLKREWRPDTHL